MTTDPAFGRDMVFLGAFVIIALADALLWRAFVRRRPAAEQRPGDVGQLTGSCLSSCLVAGLGLAALATAAALWAAGE